MSEAVPATPQRQPSGMLDDNRLDRTMSGWSERRSGEDRTGQSNSKQGEQFQKALKKAISTAKDEQTAPEGKQEIVFGMQSPALQPQNTTAQESSARTDKSGTADIVKLAERIDQHVRSNDVKASLKTGDSLLVKLPQNALGVTQVSVRLDGDILKVTVLMSAELAVQQAVQAQISQLGRSLTQKNGKYDIQMSVDDGEGASSSAEGFNPLFPWGRRREG